MSHAWTSAMLRSLLPDEKSKILLVRGTDHELLAAGAFVKSPRSPFLRFLGNHAVPEPTYILASDREAEGLLIKEVRRLGFPLELTRMPADLFNPDELGSALGRPALRVLRPEGGSPWLPLGGTWAEFEASLPANRRSDLRRAQRKAEGHGALTYRILTPIDDHRGHLLQRYIDLEKNSWKYDAGSAIELDEPALRFFNALTESPLRIVFGFLEIDGVTAAGQIMLDYANSLWVLKTAFHKDFRRCSPGVLLMHEAVKFGFSQGYDAFEFLGFEEPWLQVWTRGVHSYLTVRLYTSSPHGIAALCRDGGRSLLRRINSLPRLRPQTV
ncbi:MAG: hypothetical protein RL417_578 [Pseudomonadota bacterium]|jgi:CelD/BcsL family acetyltransferase involved in cellulose biosynthesis